MKFLYNPYKFKKEKFEMAESPEITRAGLPGNERLQRSPSGPELRAILQL
jgi:hypothetical protein